MEWDGQTTIPVPETVRERMAEYRDEYGYRRYASAILALIKESDE